MSLERERAQQCDLLSPGKIDDTEEHIARKQKRKLGDWGARYLVRKGPNGNTVYDTWKWFGEPLRRRA